MPPSRRRQHFVENEHEDDIEGWQHRVTPKTRRTFRKYTASTKSLKRQETLTQIGWVSSPYSANIDGDLEDEGNDHEVPYQTTHPKPPKKRRKLSQRETLTQMDFLSPRLNAQSIDEADEESLIDRRRSVLLAKKRRKTHKNEPLARQAQTRTARRRAAQSSAHVISKEVESGNGLRARLQSDPVHNNAKPTMLPPRTPRAPQGREIPSSQSPPDTPLSTQSKRPSRTQDRSPLAERSPNILLPASHSTSRRLFPGKLEIADTMDEEVEENEESQMTNVTTATSRIYLPPVMRLLSQPDLRDLNVEAQVHSSMGKDYNQISKSRANIKAEILDSDHEDDSEDSAQLYDCLLIADSEGSDEFIPSSSPDLVKAETSISPSKEKKDRNKKMTPAGSDISHCPLIASQTLKPEYCSPQSRLQAPNLPSSPFYPLRRDDIQAIDSPSRSTTAASELSIPDLDAPAMQQDMHDSCPPSPLNGTPTFERPAIPNLNSRSSPAIAPNFHQQVSNQEAAPETESQFQDAWRCFSPPPQLGPCSSSPNHTSPEDPSTPSSARQLEAAEPESQTASAPPSQATTVDVTQPTQPQVFLPRLRNIPSSVGKEPSRPYQISSTPPAPPSVLPLSSSPIYTRKAPHGDAWLGYQGVWNGKRLTDSQLLPESLMNDTVAGPPGWGSQVSDGLEYE